MCKMQLKIYRKALINKMSVATTIDKVKWYAVFSAWLAHYYGERELHQNKYDQDYAVNQGIIYG